MEKATYSKAEIQDLIEHSDKALYQEEFVKNVGFCTDDKELYTTEVVAEHLLSHFAQLETLLTRGAKPTRKTSYKMDSHKGIVPSKNTNQYEQVFAIKQWKKTLGALGKCIDYQTPLYDGRKSSVDMLCEAADGQRLYLVELKYGDNSESLLRCVLEILAYWYILDHEKLVTDFFGEGVKKKIVPAVFVTSGTKAAALVDELDRQDSLKKLIDRTGVEIFTVKVSGDKTEYKMLGEVERAWPSK